MLVSAQELLDDRLMARRTFARQKISKASASRSRASARHRNMRVLNILPRYGLTKKDVTFLQIGDTPARIIAVTANSVDASSFSPPDHPAAQQAGMNVLLNTAELNIFYQGHPHHQNGQSAGIRRHQLS